MTATSQSIQIVEYKGYSIQLDYTGYNFRYMFYPTEQGIQDDADFDGEDFVYCGNCKHADSIEDCKILIDEKVPFLVETFGPFAIGGRPQLHVTKFWDFIDALHFAIKHNGSMNVSFNSI
jgi:hypothetical protein